jgi:hypothetical protein
VVHKGRNARLSMYGLTPIRPTEADLNTPAPRRRKSDGVDNVEKDNKE